MSRRRGAALLSLAFGLASTNAVATTASIFGVGPRSRALAGAGVTQDLGYEATFANPAALSLTTTTSISAGYDVTSAWLYLRRPSSPERRFETAPLTGAELGFTLPLWFGSERFVLGFASLSPGGSVARADLPLAEVPQFPLLLSRQRAVDFDLALGVRPFTSWRWAWGCAPCRPFLAPHRSCAAKPRPRRASATRSNRCWRPLRG